MGIGKQDFVALTRIGLLGDGSEAVFQNSLRIQRRHDETDLRIIAGAHYEGKVVCNCEVDKGLRDGPNSVCVSLPCLFCARVRRTRLGRITLSTGGEECATFPLMSR